MNIILFKEDEIGKPLPSRDFRAKHIVKILGFGEGDNFDLGLINGPRGKGEILSISKNEMNIQFSFEDRIPQLNPITLLMAYVRPVNAQRIIRDVTSLGVEHIMLFQGEKSEKSYASSKAYNKENLLNYMKEGAEQAFCTRIPRLDQKSNLITCFDELPQNSSLYALDNYESTIQLSSLKSIGTATTLAVGPERGWSKNERDLFRRQGFALASIGERVLRTETACISGISILLGKMGKM